MDAFHLEALFDFFLFSSRTPILSVLIPCHLYLSRLNDQLRRSRYRTPEADTNSSGWVFKDATKGGRPPCFSIPKGISSLSIGPSSYHPLSFYLLSQLEKSLIRKTFESADFLNTHLRSLYLPAPPQIIRPHPQNLATLRNPAHLLNHTTELMNPSSIQS